MKKELLSIILLLFPFYVFAQKLTLGSCTISEGEGKTRVTGQYKGEMSGGKPQGKGNVLYSNGNTYEGEFVKGRRQGYGIYTFADGEKYEGQWFQNQQHGRGTYYFANNNK
ncbi:MAG: phosphatidylinositol-4-phosphate 5-kinase, partial [Prevotella buccalis]|nr:phosphatidylinositol-4-phosphate 5-kinase [Hoylesella buccalis]